MDRRKTAAAVIALLFLISAVVILMLPSNEENITDVREKANQSSYQVNYTVDFNQSLMPSKYNYTRFEAYSDGERYKNVIRYERNGTEYRNVSYLASGETLKCSGVQESIEYFDCEISESKTDFFYGLIDLAIQYSDSKGRIANLTDRCYKFNYSVRKSAVPGSQNITWSPFIENCLDREEGYVRSMTISGEIQGENGSITEVRLVDIQAEAVNESFKGSAEPEFDMLTDANCNEPEPNMDILLLDSGDDIIVTVAGINETFDVPVYEPYEVFLPAPLLKNGTNRFQVYSNNGVREVECDIENIYR